MYKLRYPLNTITDDIIPYLCWSSTIYAENIIYEHYQQNKLKKYDHYDWRYICASSSTNMANIVKEQYYIDGNMLNWYNMCNNNHPIISSIIEIEYNNCLESKDDSYEFIPSKCRIHWNALYYKASSHIATSLVLKTLPGNYFGSGCNEISTIFWNSSTPIALWLKQQHIEKEAEEKEAEEKEVEEEDEDEDEEEDEKAKKNKQLVEQINKHRDYVHNCRLLCRNESPIIASIIKREYDMNPNSDKLDWYSLCYNPSPIIVAIIKREYDMNPNSDKLDWYSLCYNPSPIIVAIIKHEYDNNRYSNNLKWYRLCYTQSPIIAAIIKYEYEIGESIILDQFNWTILCASNFPIIASIIEQEYGINPTSEKLDWRLICGNELHVNIIKQELIRNDTFYNKHSYLLSFNKSKEILEIILNRTNILYLINVTPIWSNPHICICDYDAMKETKKNINREVIEYFFHPNRISNNNYNIE